MRPGRRPFRSFANTSKSRSAETPTAPEARDCAIRHGIGNRSDDERIQDHDPSRPASASERRIRVRPVVPVSSRLMPRCLQLAGRRPGRPGAQGRGRVRSRPAGSAVERHSPIRVCADHTKPAHGVGLRVPSSLQPSAGETADPHSTTGQHWVRSQRHRFGPNEGSPIAKKFGDSILNAILDTCMGTRRVSTTTTPWCRNA